jgi:hypothetical protein
VQTLTTTFVATDPNFTNTPVTKSVTLVVNPAPLTVTADNKTKAYGAANPALTATISGFVNGDDASSVSGTAALATTAITTSSPGSYPISVAAGTLSSSNYVFQTFVPGTLTVTGNGTATINGLVYFDVNVSQQFDSGDFGLGGVQVVLRNSANTIVATASTTAAGNYSFTVNPGALYYVSVVVPAGTTPSTPSEFSLTPTADVSLQTGLALDFVAMQTMQAGGLSQGYWKNNLSKAIAGKPTGTQQTAQNLCDYTNAIRGYALTPFSDLAYSTPTAPAGLNQAVTIFSSTASDPASLLKKQLLASEYNLANAAFINGNATLTAMFIYWGEYVLVNSASYGSTYTLWAKDWFDAYNNSHGGSVSGPSLLGTSSSASNFNGTAVAAGNYLWFNGVVAVTGRNTSQLTSVRIDQATVQFTANGTDYTLDVPASVITFDPLATVASNNYDEPSDTWLITVPASYTGNVSLGGLAWQAAAGLPGGINPVTWKARFTSPTAGLSAQWKWAAAVYTNFATNDSVDALGMKSTDSSSADAFSNSDHAGTPEFYKAFVVGGARGGGGSNWTGSYSGTATVSIAQH